MTFRERYNQEATWHGKVMIMEIYHLAMLHKLPDWTLLRTAEYFQCSIGLISENLRLAQSIHFNVNLLECSSRQEALKKTNNHRRERNGTL